MLGGGNRLKSSRGGLIDVCCGSCGCGWTLVSSWTVTYESTVVGRRHSGWYIYFKNNFKLDKSHTQLCAKRGYHALPTVQLDAVLKQKNCMQTQFTYFFPTFLLLVGGYICFAVYVYVFMCMQLSKCDIYLTFFLGRINWSVVNGAVLIHWLVDLISTVYEAGTNSSIFIWLGLRQESTNPT